jgi:hypothetical protein
MSEEFKRTPAYVPPAVGSEEEAIEFIREFPELAFRTEEMLRTTLEIFVGIVRGYEQLIDEAAAGWRAAVAHDKQRDQSRTENERRYEAWERSRRALNQRAATAANSRRRRETDAKLKQLVRDRIQLDPHLTAKELAFEAIKTGLAKKNKTGEVMKFDVVVRKIAPLVRSARTDLRKRKP